MSATPARPELPSPRTWDRRAPSRRHPPREGGLRLELVAAAEPADASGAAESGRPETAGASREPASSAAGPDAGLASMEDFFLWALAEERQ